MSKLPLERYAAKRSFARTPEPPAATPAARSGPLLFVVQKHAARALHYDFRLELDGVLKSWAVPKGPSSDPGDKRMAVEVEDHPFEYASFEGVIPAGQYGAGNVIVWDCGSYSPDEGGRYAFDDRGTAQARIRAELAAGKLSLFLCGEKLKGSYTLVRTAKTNQWLLIKHQDRFAHANDLPARHRSVLSGASLEELAPRHLQPRFPAARLAAAGPAEVMPKKLTPMLADSGALEAADAAWRYEPKLDGYRVIASIEQGSVRLNSRRGLDLTAFFPELVADLAPHPAGTLVLDGEIVALDASGRPSFNALQNRAQLKSAAEIAAAQRAAPVALVCFDLLHFAGMNLRQAAYADRHRYLAQCLLPTARVQLMHSSGTAEELYHAALALGFEGIMAKRLDSTYQPGARSRAWLKIKSSRSSEFVIGGYTRGKGSREPLGALLLGYYEGAALRYAGHVGSGLEEASIGELLKRAARLERKSPPFAEPPPLHRPTTWLKPHLVAEVTYSEWTAAGALRAPVFLRLRDDVAARSVVKPANTAAAARRAGRTVVTRPARMQPTAPDGNEIVAQLQNPANNLELRVGDVRIKLTNLDRVYWPAQPKLRREAISKRDLLAYLARVARFMLPHLADRPLTMIRMPEGINGERFFQKHWAQSLPDFVESVTVFSETKDERHRYLLANNLPTLLWLGQVGTLEFHVWHSRASLLPEAAGAKTDYSSSLETLEASILNYPDYLVFDIDPYIYSGKEGKGAEPELNKRGFAVGKRVAFWLRDLLQQMSLRAIVKTSGKTGLHVFVPIERTVTFDEARHICETVGRHVMREHPREITMEWAVEKRTGKIFIDYNMNVRGKTLNVAYSPRGVPGAPVSMPLTWEELEAADPMDFTIKDVPARLEKSGDRWHDVLEIKQSLTKAFGVAREK
jgi:bifunctional non-homologous end joining protein LigD